MLMVDPKMVELNMYSGIPHLLSPVVTEVEKVVPLLKNAIAEMERRYRLFSQLGVRNLDGYRKLRTEKLLRGDTSLKNLPAIVIIIDELADLMMAAPEEVEGMICRLAQLARATGIHLVVATQRPSVDVITGLIKANIPTRIAFQVSSKIDSRTILDQSGAETLLGNGDMLYLPPGTATPERVHGAFVGDDDVHKVVEWLRTQGEPNYIDGVLEEVQTLGDGKIINESGLPEEEDGNDDNALYDKAVQIVTSSRRASISGVQRHLRIGYNRAARLIEQMEQEGVVSAPQHNGQREVIAPPPV